jgi:hypothetical protein
VRGGERLRERVVTERRRARVGVRVMLGARARPGRRLGARRDDALAEQQEERRRVRAQLRREAVAQRVLLLRRGGVEVIRRERRHVVGVVQAPQHDVAPLAPVEGRHGPELAPLHRDRR